MRWERSGLLVLAPLDRSAPLLFLTIFRPLAAFSSFPNYFNAIVMRLSVRTGLHAEWECGYNVSPSVDSFDGFGGLLLLWG